MQLNFKTYQVIKLKKYLKNDTFVLFYYSTKLDLTKWVFIEQNLKKLELDYYKPLNKTTIKIIKKTIFKSFSYNVTGFILFISNSKHHSNLVLINKPFNSFLTLMNLKLNNKIYSKPQLKGLKSLCYNKTLFKLYKVLNKELKTSYLLVNNK